MKKKKGVITLLGCILCFSSIILVNGSILNFGVDSSKLNRLYFEVEPQDAIVRRDEAAILNCSASGNPKPVIKWKRDQQLLNFRASQRRKLLSNGSLYFEEVYHTRSERPDEGIYQCIASIEGVGTIVSREAKLQIAALPKFEEEPPDQTVEEGDTARFSCTIRGVPAAEITWMKDKRLLRLDEARMLVLPSGSLQIDDVEFLDQGAYQCNARNIDKNRLSQEGHLKVIRRDKEPTAPEFVARPQDKVVKEGEKVTLECAANGYPRPTITWLKDGTTIDVAHLDSGFYLEGFGNLQIDKVDESDAGTYQCRAENGHDSLDASAELQVQVPPRFLRRPDDKIASTKEDIEFECEIYGKPDPTVKWLKNGEILFASEYFQIVSGSNLRILGLVEADSAVYQCVGSNPAGNIQASAHLRVLTDCTAVPYKCDYCGLLLCLK